MQHAIFLPIFFQRFAWLPCTAGQDISTYLDPCVAPPYIGLDCLIIREPFYLAFIAATCVDNVAQMTLATTQTCFMLDTSGNGVGYGQWVHYYTSSQGCACRGATAFWGGSFPGGRFHSDVCAPCLFFDSHAIGRSAPRLLGVELPQRTRNDQR